MSRRSGGRKTIIPIVGHPSKFSTSEKWARDFQRRGKGVLVDHIFYWFPRDVAIHTHRERDAELREIERFQFDMHPRTCRILPEPLPGGPQFKTVQFERTLKNRDREPRRAG